MSEFNFSTTIARKRTVHLFLEKDVSISPFAAKVVHPSPSFTNCPFGEIFNFNFSHKDLLMKEVVAPLSIVMFIGFLPQKTVRTGELTGVILLSWHESIEHKQ